MSSEFNVNTLDTQLLITIINAESGMHLRSCYY